MDDVVAPWRFALSSPERTVILYATSVTAMALLAMLVRTWVVRREVSGRYRAAIAASLGVLTVAFVSYVLIAAQLLGAYRFDGAQWVPGPDAASLWTLRFVDWSVTVPLLVVELIAVSTLRGRTIARVRLAGIVAAFLMIATGFVGGMVVDDGGSRTAMLVWGLISSLFFIVLYALVLMTVLRSLLALPSAARPAYRLAMIVLMVTWFVYPVVFGLQGFTSSGTMVTVLLVVLCAADVVAKVGFISLIHRVAKLRTGFDVQAGVDTHPETLWVDGARISDALHPPVAEIGLIGEPLRQEALSADRPR